VRWPGWFTGEFFGTFLLVFFGCGSVCAAVTTGGQVGLFQVAIVWGLGIGWWMVYIVAPVVGGLLGGGIYAACFRQAYRGGEL
jgi:glycerol uptake facilitator protein